ncbi:flagellar hook-associated protein 2 [Homoserinimonas aerilata]|uniref:Flagellar hook-associated protein 2 n=1 Tax=Homoserinimonas aerilata TaxID=1162970 RepID=A0A542YET7_9MICO|nr:flagellar filament capping protein FliD [Homoserinimonas aerilata]TQL46605.1 flagellar hook-associated protein 2 [Homoserinimonas aerilata]
MGITLPGLASGLNSADLIASFMQLEAIPQTLLKNKATVTSSTVTVLQALNTRIASLAELAKTAAKPAALDLHKATSSTDAVTASVGTGASAGSLEFTVDALAQSQSAVTAALTEWPSTGPITIVGADGTQTELSPASASLDDVVRAINASDAGVKAVKVASGADGNGDPLFRLQLTSATTGADAAFSIYQGSAAEVDGGTATDLLAAPGAAMVKQAQDAKITLWGGTGAEQSVTSTSNTFTALLPGVDVNVTKTSTDPVTIEVARDSEAATKVAKDLVASLTDIFIFIDSRSKVTTAGSGSDSTAKGGIFTGDSTVRGAKQALLSAITMPINGHSPSEIGISITKTGTIEFDAEKFAAALASDPAKVETAMAGLADRVATTATAQSDKYDGLLTSKINGQEKLVSTYNDQIEAWDLRLEKRQSTLERTYAALEVRMGAFNSQSAWLTSQIASLPTYGGNTK